METDAIKVITETGLLGALLVIALLAIAYLYRAQEAKSARAIEERGEFVRVMIESAASNEKIASSIDNTNRTLQSLADAQRQLTDEVRRSPAHRGGGGN